MSREVDELKQRIKIYILTGIEYEKEIAVLERSKSKMREEYKSLDLLYGSLRKSFALSVAKECKCENNADVNMGIVERNLELRERIKELNDFKSKAGSYEIYYRKEQKKHS